MHAARCECIMQHYSDVIMAVMFIVYSTIYSGADQRKHHSSALLTFVRGSRRWPVYSPHKLPVTRKLLPFDDVIMIWWYMGKMAAILVRRFNQNVVFGFEKIKLMHDSKTALRENLPFPHVCVVSSMRCTRVECMDNVNRKILPMLIAVGLPVVPSSTR